MKSINAIVQDIEMLDETLAGLVADASEAAMRQGEAEAMLHLNSQAVNANRLGLVYRLLEQWQVAIRQQLLN